MTPGTRRNGSSKFGPFNRAIRDPWAQSSLGARGDRDHEYTGRHVSPRRETARKRVGKAVPVAAVAATLAAGAAAYSLTGAGQPAAAQLNAATVRPSTASSSVVGKTNAAADAMIRATTAPAFASHAATAAAPTAKAKPAASRTSTRSPAAPAAHASAATTRAAAITRAASHPAATTLSCDLNYSLLPQNVTAIVSFLLAHGYSDNAAAGIAGNIYQESKGDPESVGMGGGGLIGWTPLPYGFVTGDVSADLQTQLAALLTYNQIWSSYLPALNSAASPADAAYIDVTDFERAGIPAASTREASAENVASACGI